MSWRVKTVCAVNCRERDTSYNWAWNLCVLIFLFRSCRKYIFFFVPTVSGQVKVVVLSALRELWSVSAVLNPSNTKFHGNLLTDFRVVTAGYTRGRTKYWRTCATLYCEQPTVTEVTIVNND